MTTMDERAQALRDKLRQGMSGGGAETRRDTGPSRDAQDYDADINGEAARRAKPVEPVERDVPRGSASTAPPWGGGAGPRTPPTMPSRAAAPPAMPKAARAPREAPDNTQWEFKRKPVGNIYAIALISSVVIFFFEMIAVLLWGVGAYTTKIAFEAGALFLSTSLGFTIIYSFWTGLGAWQWALPISFSLGELSWSPFFRIFRVPAKMMAILAVLALGGDLWTAWYGIPLLPIPEDSAFVGVQDGLGRIIATVVVTLAPEAITVMCVFILIIVWRPVIADIRNRWFQGD